MASQRIAKNGAEAVVAHGNVLVNDGDEVTPDEDILEAPEEQADEIRQLPTPTLPSLSEIQKHRECHIPYQSWCDQCVEGRGREMGHTSVDMESRSVATIAFDYLFVNDKGLFTRNEIDIANFENDGTGVKVLVVKDSKSKMLFAHVEPVKGIDEKKSAVDELATDIVWL